MLYLTQVPDYSDQPALYNRVKTYEVVNGKNIALQLPPDTNDCPAVRYKVNRYWYRPFQVLL